ncbi:hypothetical protein C1M53_26345 [Mesorhizobium sp. Pch-S]|nr:hypothetical protein C1M53_26345 [Mesorhizobium sp. Pch-S]
MADQFVAALPEHIKPERFQRIVLTAVLSDPALLKADRKSLLESAMRAAQDGLMPDKREGAFVVFNTKIGKDDRGKDVYGNAVQWMPMIGGIIKKMHQSGEIAMVTAKVVYGGDIFRAWVDDDGEHVNYEQAEHPDFETIRQVFALAKTKDGAVYVETLTPRDIEKIRSVSRSKDKGPWATWWEEMAKKSAIRRLAKRLPLSADMHDLIQRDNDLYDLSQAPDPRPSLQQRLQVAKLAAPGPSDDVEGFDAAHVTRETAALTGEPASGQTEDNSQSSDTPADDNGSDGKSPSPESTVAADLSEPADEADEEEDAPASEQEKPSNGSAAASSSEPTRTRADCIKAFMTTATDPDLDVAGRRDLLEQMKDWWKADLPNDLDFVKACLSTAEKVAKGELGAEAARKYLEGLL